MSENIYKIGYVDEDPLEVSKFERKLRDKFDLISYDIPKGLPKDELINQIYNSDIDLLMVDFMMNDKGHLTYNGDEVVRDFEDVKPRFPMIIFTNNDGDAFPAVDNPNIIYDKDLVTSKKDYFVSVIIKNIEVYKRFITERKEKINSLITKRVNEELSAKEKEELFTLQLDLNNLDQRTKEAPTFLIDELKLNKLADTTREAEQYLNDLLGKK